jgi:N-formylglutamate deformylase
LRYADTTAILAADFQVEEGAVPTYHFTQGRIPMLVSMPHPGTELPPGFSERLSEPAKGLPDTDWHLPELYDFLGEIGCSVLVARYSRLVVDLNRSPDDAPLYTTATTGLIPPVLFDGTPVYRPGAGPAEAERRERVERYWRPYHARLESELARLREAHGTAVLFEAHSIRSEIPRLFAGRLPDFNIGTNEGDSADPGLAKDLSNILAAAKDYTAILNGRFKGGYITRNYGAPARDIHAVQLELVQATYMDETPPFAFRPDRAALIRPHLRRFVEALAKFATAKHQ